MARANKLAVFVAASILTCGIVVSFEREISGQTGAANTGGTRCTPLSTSGVTKTSHRKSKKSNMNGNSNSGTSNTNSTSR